MVSNLYVRQANLKVILELTGSQCSSDRRAVADIMKYLAIIYIIKNSMFVIIVTHLCRTVERKITLCGVADNSDQLYLSFLRLTRFAFPFFFVLIFVSGRASDL